jgi:hypothetical protein
VTGAVRGLTHRSAAVNLQRLINLGLRNKRHLAARTRRTSAEVPDQAATRATAEKPKPAGETGGR